mmetsp:Transcript_17250/g.51708  ORF Transcript_17250/g.51708 Transcript_17250/m.51708 type:complete len:531 (-) Transcript_17250:378-1970(-)
MLGEALVELLRRVCPLLARALLRRWREVDAQRAGRGARKQEAAARVVAERGEPRLALARRQNVLMLLLPLPEPLQDRPGAVPARGEDLTCGPGGRREVVRLARVRALPLHRRQVPPDEDRILARRPEVLVLRVEAHGAHILLVTQQRGNLLQGPRAEDLRRLALARRQQVATVGELEQLDAADFDLAVQLQLLLQQVEEAEVVLERDGEEVAERVHGAGHRLVAPGGHPLDLALLGGVVPDADQVVLLAEGHGEGPLDGEVEAGDGPRVVAAGEHRDLGLAILARHDRGEVHPADVAGLGADQQRLLRVGHVHGADGGLVAGHAGGAGVLKLLDRGDVARGVVHPLPQGHDAVGAAEDEALREAVEAVGHGVLAVRAEGVLDLADEPHLLLADEEDGPFRGARHDARARLHPAVVRDPALRLVDALERGLHLEAGLADLGREVLELHYPQEVRAGHRDLAVLGRRGPDHAVHLAVQLALPAEAVDVPLHDGQRHLGGLHRHDREEAVVRVRGEAGAQHAGRGRGAGHRRG